MEQKKIPFVIRPGALGNAILVLGIGVLGLVMAHHPMLCSGFRRIQTDLGDTRLAIMPLDLPVRVGRGKLTVYHVVIFDAGSG